MNSKKMMLNIKKMPLLCLIGITVFLSDGLYEEILPWPSPFHFGTLHADGKNEINALLPDGTDSVCDAQSGINSGEDSETILQEDDVITASQESGEAPDGQDVIPAGSDGDPSMETGAPDDSSFGPSPEPAPEPVQYGEDGLPIVNYMEVGDDYFDDAVFIGDSRTRSLQLYAGLDNTTFLADTGLSIYTVLSKKLTPSTMNSKTTVEDYLAEHQFKKVYLMLGINELGTGNANSFCEKYREVLTSIQELQPDAIIYIQAILHISEAKHNENTYINNDAIIERNEALKSLADNVRIFWLDANPVICDDKGYLIDGYTFDGVHLQAKYVSIWTDWLKQHAVQLREDVSAHDAE